MSHITEIFLGIFLVFVPAQVGAEIAQRLRLPAVVGEITAGITRQLSCGSLKAPRDALLRLDPKE